MSHTNTPLRRTDRSLPIALLRARETIMGPIRVMLAESHVNEQKWRVLRVLEERGAMEMTAVAQAACLLLPSLTRIIRAMEDEGLVKRNSDPDDKRKSLLSISAAGKAVIQNHSAASNALFSRLQDRFGADKLETLLDLLEDLRAVKFDP